MITDVVLIYAMAFHVDQEQLVHLENVCAHWVILAMQTMLAKDAIYVVNAKSIKTANIPKFVSNLAEVYEIALMLAVNSNVDQMHCAYLRIIDQLVFAATVTVAIQTISIWVVSRLVNVLNSQMHAIVMLIVNVVIFVLLAQTVLKIVLIHVRQLLVAQMKNVVLMQIQIQLVTAKTRMLGIHYDQFVKNHRYQIVQAIVIVIISLLVNQTRLEF